MNDLGLTWDAFPFLLKSTLSSSSPHPWEAGPDFWPLGSISKQLAGGSRGRSGTYSLYCHPEGSHFPWDSCDCPASPLWLRCGCSPLTPICTSRGLLLSFVVSVSLAQTLVNGAFINPLLPDLGVSLSAGLLNDAGPCERSWDFSLVSIRIVSGIPLQQTHAAWRPYSSTCSNGQSICF